MSQPLRDPGFNDPDRDFASVSPGRYTQLRAELSEAQTCLVDLVRAAKQWNVHSCTIVLLQIHAARLEAFRHMLEHLEGENRVVSNYLSDLNLVALSSLSSCIASERI